MLHDLISIYFCHPVHCIFVACISNLKLLSSSSFIIQSKIHFSFHSEHKYFNRARLWYQKNDEAQATPSRSYQDPSCICPWKNISHLIVNQISILKHFQPLVMQKLILRFLAISQVITWKRRQFTPMVPTIGFYIQILVHPFPYFEHSLNNL